MRLYIIGAALFFVGVGLIIFINRSISPSLEQELYMLFGLLIGGSGFITAMTAQCCMIAQRLGLFPDDQTNADNTIDDVDNSSDKNNQP